MNEVHDALRDVDLCRLLKVSKTYFYTLKKSGKFARFEIHPSPTKTTRYSGKLVRAWLDADLSTSRFFGGARRHRVA